MGIGYLLAAPHPWQQRLRRGVLAGAVTVGLSLAWITAIMLTPAADRPYIDGTTNNNGYTMVFGYNGFNRIIPNLIEGVIGNRASGMASVIQSRPFGAAAAHVPLGDLTTHPGSQQPPALGSAPHSRPVGPSGQTAKLLLPTYTTQVGWLYPLAAAGALLGVAPLATAAKRRRRTRQRSASAGLPPSPITPQDQLHAGASGPTIAALETPGAVAVPDGFTDPRESLEPSATRTEHPACGPDIDRQVAGRVMAAAGTAVALTLWLIITAVFLSVTAIPHTTYLSAISVQTAVLAAAGLVHAWRLRTVPTRTARWALPIVLVTQTAWTLHVLASSTVAPTFLAPAVLILGLCAVGATLPIVKLPNALRRPTAAIAVISVMLAPAVWSSFNVTNGVANYGDAYGGPEQSIRYQGHPASGAGGQPFQPNNPFNPAPDPRLNPAQQALVDYLQAHVQGAGNPLMATDTWRQAEPFILYAGLDVLPMGGFTGNAPTPTLQHFQQLITSGALRFVLLHNSSRPLGRHTAVLAGIIDAVGMTDGSNTQTLRIWTIAHCAIVPQYDYLTPNLHLPNQTLFDCAPRDALRTTRG